MSTEPVPFAALLDTGDVKACCASIYESEAVAWLLDGQLHPGGPALTRRAGELAGIGRGDRVLDVASGRGASARLLARELGAEVTGIDLGTGAVAAARAETVDAGLAGRTRFVEGDAESLPFAGGGFDAVICECSLCTFPDKLAAVEEMARVLDGEGRVAIADVTADTERLPAELRTVAAQVACLADALPASGYVGLLEAAGLEVVAAEPHDRALEAMVDKVEARLRLARMLRIQALAPFRGQLEAAVALARLAGEAVRDGRLGYSLFVARRRRSPRSRSRRPA